MELDQTSTDNILNERLAKFEVYLKSGEAADWLNRLEKEKSDVRNLVTKLSAMDRESSDFSEWVLYGLLPYKKTSVSKRESIFPIIYNIKKFFERASNYNYGEEDWKKIAQMIFRLASGFRENPKRIEQLITEFTSDRHSRGIQSGYLSPIFFALSDNLPPLSYPILHAFENISGLLGENKKLTLKLNEYLDNIKKLENVREKLRKSYLNSQTIFHVFLFWYALEYYYRPKNEEKKREKESQRQLTEFSEDLESVEDRPTKLDLPIFIETVNLGNPSEFEPHLLPNPEKIRINEIISECSNTRWVIPRFQRYFEWKKEGVKDFLKAIFNDYYVGAFLLWDTHGEPEVKVQSVKGVERKDLKSNVVILDGQQRITSLFYVISAPNSEIFTDKANWNDTGIYKDHPQYFYIDFAEFLRTPSLRIS
jgi:hypothetical protein